MQLLLYFFLASVFIQCIYWLAFLLAFSRRDVNRHTPLQPVSPPVSVIVCAHDEEENLKALVPLLLNQHYPNFEVVVVNDRSNDNTYDWLLAETKKDARLRMVNVEETPNTLNPKKYAVTLGIKAAKNDWLLFTDADCRPLQNTWIQTMSGAFTEHTEFVLGYSPYVQTAGMLNRFIRFETLITAIQYMGFALLGQPYMGVGRNLAYRKSSFMKSKGFTTLLPITGGDDDLYVNRHATFENIQVIMGASSLVHSTPHISWSAYGNQKLRHLAVGKHYRFKHRFLLGVFTLTWMGSWFILPVLLVTLTGLGLVAGGFILRQILITLTIDKANKRLGQTFELAAIAVLDFMYAFYYLVAGLRALVSKNVRWKKN